MSHARGWPSSLPSILDWGRVPAAPYSILAFRQGSVYRGAEKRHKRHGSVIVGTPMQADPLVVGNEDSP
jgi:hypothetical protein